MEQLTNFQDGTINATLNTSTGSQVITGLFKAVPAFPTLISPQFIKLVLDFNEVVYLTAYTSGSLNGTITRGREGTTPVAHTAGSGSWFNAPTVQNWPNDEQHLTQYGIFGDSVTDNAALMNAQLLDYVTSLSAACTAISPPGIVAGSVPFVVPPLLNLRGSGWHSSGLKITTDNDVLQMFQGNGTTMNGFFSKVENLLLHGVSPGLNPYGYAATAGQWNNCMTVVLNPADQQANGDPDFDPQHLIERIWGKLASGEGYYHQGRSEVTLHDVWMAYNGGVGFWSSYDTEYEGCKAEGNGTAGWYIPHSDVKLTGCNSFNNGGIIPFATGLAWVLGQTTISVGLVYACKLAYTSSATAPASDTTHWVKIAPSWRATGAAPEWGNGYYLDGVSRVTFAACGADGNRTNALYLHNSSDNNIQCQASNVNFNNGVVPAVAFGTNPNNYSAVVLDGSNNNIINVTTAALSTGYAVRLINGSTGNIINITTDGTEAAIFSPDSTAFAGNNIIVNGKTYLQTDAVFVGNATGAVTMPPGWGAYRYTLTGNATFTPPTVAAGKGFVMDVIGAHTWTLSGVHWVGATVPTPTASASNYDRILAYSTSGTEYGCSALLNNG